MEDKYMTVWDSPSACIPRLRRLVIKINGDGSCLAIQQGHEEGYKRGETISLVRWEHCEEIKEIKHRHLTVKDYDVDLLHKLYRLNYSPDNAYKATGISKEKDAFFLLINSRWICGIELFKEWEIFDNGTWHPVGKKI